MTWHILKTSDWILNFSSALDEAAAALTRMRAEPTQDSGRSLVAACSEGDIGEWSVYTCTNVCSVKSKEISKEHSTGFS